MKAFRLINTTDNRCAFEEGTVPELTHVKVSHFFAQTNIEEYQKDAHPAPRYQYVVTLKGKLKFTVSDGSSFIIEPGILLIANDIKGDTIYTFTDGYADQFGGPKGKKFKYKQLQEMLLAASDLPLDTQKEQLNTAFEKWKGDLEQVDDVCVIGIRI